VTFLAFCNGAPDVFSAIAATRSAKSGDLGLSFGALLGEYMKDILRRINRAIIW
jgi:Ca2+/Na+ antiporter